MLVMATGESEFGGVGGMVPQQQVGRETMQQQVWEVYGTNVAAPPGDPSGVPTADRVGKTPPLESSS